MHPFAAVEDVGRLDEGVADEAPPQHESALTAAAVSSSSSMAQPHCCLGTASAAHEVLWGTLEDAPTVDVLDAE